jgi:coproporphyrinogen III oxidase
MTPPDVDAVRAHLAGLQERIGVALDAASVSLIVHPRNPYAPTIT